MSSTRPSCALALLGLLGCGGATPDAAHPTTTHDAPPPARMSPLVFGPCAGDAPERAECATMTAPLDYGAPDGETIEVAVMRIPSAAPDGTQLWYLPGGPGGAGTTLLGILQQRYGATWSGADLYTIDHRGTGGTSRLSCPSEEAPDSPGSIGVRPEEVDGCVAAVTEAQGPRLAHLTASHAARDLARAMAAARTDRGRQLIWGNSYGTYWAFRFLELFPDAADGVFLEALAPPGMTYRTFDYWMNETGMRLMQRCAETPSCASRFEADPVEVARGLRARLDAGHCAALDLPVSIGWFLGSMLYDHDLRGMLPLLVRMMDRCHERDVERLRRLYQATFRDRGMLTAGDFSAPLYAHVVLSELWHGEPPDGRSLDEVAASCLFCPGDRADMDRARDAWPTYRAEADRPLEYDGPLWMLQGGLDPAVPPDLAAAMAGSLRGPAQHYIAFPLGAHTLTGKTPTADGDCALGLLRAFIEAPDGAPNLECVADSPPPPLPSGPEALVTALLGPGDPWSVE